MIASTPSPVFARRATRADAVALVGFLNHAAQADNVERFDVLGYLQDFVLPSAQIEAGQVFLAMRGTRVGGVASVIFRHDGDIDIEALVVDPDAGLSEIGGALMAECRAFAAGVKASCLYATIREDSAPALTGWGFDVVGIDEAIVGSTALSMRMDI